MALRFRKSVKICDGLRLNFGKTGASVTVGSGPFKKTYNTNGNVTTTIGLPGTGVYWTETERPGTRNNRRTSTRPQARASAPSSQNDYYVSPTVNDYFTKDNRTDGVDTFVASEPSGSQFVPDTSTSGNDDSRLSTVVTAETNVLSLEDIKQIYLYEDAPVDWTELVAGATADDLLMDPIAYSYCAHMAPRILSGDVDAYLAVIERMRPVDDLALFSGDFEFGTDSPSYIEVEFTATPERVLRGGATDPMFEEFVSAIAIRVARDLFALLPVTRILVHIQIGNLTILSVLIDRKKMLQTNFKHVLANSFVRTFPHLIVEDYNNLKDVGRLTINGH